MKRHSANSAPALDELASVRTLMRERARVVRFVRSRVVDSSDAEEFVRHHFCEALSSQGRLRRGESVITWLERVMVVAVTRQFGDGGGDRSRNQLWRESEDPAARAEWTGLLRSCVRALLPTLKPRYAELITRLDLAGESKSFVARELRITTATADVVLHRARHVMQRRLQVLCAASSRERCVAAGRETTAR